MNLQKTSQYVPAKSIDEVLDQLHGIIVKTAEEDNFLCAFACVYRQTTLEVKKAIEDKQFEDADRMEKMDVVFANYYIQAYHDFLSAKEVSRSWAFAFQAKDTKLSLIQHILFGMNAHINLDLSAAAATITTGASILDLKNDFMLINDILARLTNQMQMGLGSVSLFMKLLDIFGFRKDEKIINFSIRKARDFAWLNAVELALLDEKGKLSRLAEIDLRVLEISKMIRNPPGRLMDIVLKIIALFEVTDKQKITQALQKT